MLHATVESWHTSDGYGQNLAKKKSLQRLRVFSLRSDAEGEDALGSVFVGELILPRSLRILLVDSLGFMVQDLRFELWGLGCGVVLFLLR